MDLRRLRHKNAENMTGTDPGSLTLSVPVFSFICVYPAVPELQPSGLSFSSPFLPHTLSQRATILLR